MYIHTYIPPILPYPTPLPPPWTVSFFLLPNKQIQMFAPSKRASETAKQRNSTWKFPTVEVGGCMGRLWVSCVEERRATYLCGDNKKKMLRIDKSHTFDPGFFHLGSPYHAKEEKKLLSSEKQFLELIKVIHPIPIFPFVSLPLVKQKEKKEKKTPTPTNHPPSRNPKLKP